MAAPVGALALIPARGGSKGIPGKNLQEVAGIPLVCRSIRAAQASQAVQRVAVSTDDDAIAAAYARHTIPGIDRIVIIDFDVHHHRKTFFPTLFDTPLKYQAGYHFYFRTLERKTEDYISILDSFDSTQMPTN